MKAQLFQLLVKPFLLLTAILLLGTFCNKKLFHKVAVKGRILHFFTGQPVSAAVGLSSDNKFSGSAQDLGIANGHSDSEGYFSMKGKASKANTYYLGIEGDPNGLRQVQVNEKGTTDLGTFYTGTQTIFCKVKFIPDSGKCIQYYNDKNIFLAAGTYTTLTSSITLNGQDRLYFFISYATFNCSNSSTKTNFSVGIPVTGPDTLNYTIRY